MTYGFNHKPRIAVKPKDLEKPYRLKNDIIYKSKRIIGINKRIVINKGYGWDGATIPKFLWSLVGSKHNPEFLPATMIHDWLCEHKKFIAVKGVYTSSMIFKDILIEYKVNPLKATIMALAVYLWQKTQKGWN